MLTACVSGQQRVQNPRHPTVLTDNEIWELNRESKSCEGRVSAAIAQYKKAPLYSAWREPFSDRYLVNATSDCWVELTIQGVDDVSYLFKVTADNEVIDQRGLSAWGLTVFPYPDGPVYLDGTS